VVYEFEDLAVPTLLIIGDKDNTAIAKDFAPPAVRATPGRLSATGEACGNAHQGRHA